MVRQNNGLDKIRLNSVQEIENKAKAYFKNAWLYTVMDFGVGFGTYKDSRLLVRMGNQDKPVPLDWEYVQELRIFDRDCELRLMPSKKQWVGRYRKDNLDEKNCDRELEGFIIDENQKLWGKVEKHEIVDGLYWSLLASDRGTRLWVPIELKEHEEAAVCVRKYMGPPESGTRGLVYQTDIRMIGFCRWNGNIKGQE